MTEKIINLGDYKQRKPKGKGRDIIALVKEDLQSRSEYGIMTYGETLKAFNGRDALLDAYQEALDLAVYLRQVIEERDNGIL